jgi:HEAT repeat protein
MNELLQKLTGGNLLSDGKSKEVAKFVLEHPEQISDLFVGLYEKAEAIRARTADALEFVSRRRPDLLKGQLPLLMELAVNDSVDMVRWHMAMIFANLEYEDLQLADVLPTLFYMLEDKSNMVKPWAISTLAILRISHPEIKNEIIPRLRPLLSFNRPSVSKRQKSSSGPRAEQPFA